MKLIKHILFLFLVTGALFIGLACSDAVYKQSEEDIYAKDTSERVKEPNETTGESVEKTALSSSAITEATAVAQNNADVSDKIPQDTNLSQGVNDAPVNFDPMPFAPDQAMGGPAGFPGDGLGMISPLGPVPTPYWLLPYPFLNFINGFYKRDGFIGGDDGNDDDDGHHRRRRHHHDHHKCPGGGGPKDSAPDQDDFDWK